MFIKGQVLQHPSNLKSEFNGKVLAEVKSGTFLTLCGIKVGDESDGKDNGDVFYSFDELNTEEGEAWFKADKFFKPIIELSEDEIKSL